MSLCGSLTDLSVPELLQIVALSRKTGVLEICSEDDGIVWLALQNGDIVRVSLEGGSIDREEVMKREGLDDRSPAELVEAALWDAALKALLSLFEWSRGRFTFEPSGDPALNWHGAPGIALRSPLSPEFLALESARIADEDDADLPATKTSLDDVPELQFDLGPEPEPEPAEAPQAKRAGISAVICVDTDLQLLERIKVRLTGDGQQVHIFQDSGSALTRLKQYVLRGEFPALILGAGVRDPLDGHRGMGWERFAERVKSLAARVEIFAIGEGAPGRPCPGVRWLERPCLPSATEAEIDAFLATLANEIGVAA